MSAMLRFLTGPTACGKKEISVEAALALNAEIISMDSMKVYRDMTIGAAAPSQEALRRVPHYLIGFVSPEESFNVGRYRHFAMQAVEDVLSRGREVLFVGGTPLYLRALREGLFEGPPAVPEVRKRLYAVAEEKGIAEIHRMLERVDPVAASKIHPNDLKRLVRALEVFEVTGRPISELQRTSTSTGCPLESVAVILRREKKDLHARIEARVEKMLERGLVEEVRLLISRYTLSGEVRKSIGYREITEYLEGRLSLAQAKELIIRRTRQMVKRQMTWFRSMKDARWVDIPPGTDAVKMLPEVLSALKG